MIVKNKRLRVALLSSFLVDYTIKLATPLCHYVDVLVVADDPALARDVTVDEVQLLVSAGGLLKTFSQARIWNRWWSVISVLIILLRFRPHIIIAHEHAHPHLSWIVRGSRLFSKFLLIVHDPKPHIGQDMAFALGNRSQTLLQRRIATGFIVHGQFCKRSLREQLDERDFRLIHPIVMGPNFAPDKPFEYKRQRRLLMFGRMEIYKGLELLLDACQLLRKRGVSFELRLAGRGPELDRLAEKFLALKCCSIESGYISRDEALQEFENADLLVTPYLEATQSGVTALAFATGRPVVATNVGGLADFIKHDVNGLLVTPNSPILLADALERMLEEPGLAERLAQGAVVSGLGDHSWGAISDSLWKAIQDTSK